jgi:hypothetical protein
LLAKHGLGKLVGPKRDGKFEGKAGSVSSVKTGQSFGNALKGTPGNIFEANGL